MARLECTKCGAPVEVTEAGRKDARIVFHLGFTCGCQVLKPHAQQAQDAFWQGYDHSRQGDTLICRVCDALFLPGQLLCEHLQP